MLDCGARVPGHCPLKWAGSVGNCGGTIVSRTEGLMLGLVRYLALVEVGRV